MHIKILVVSYNTNTKLLLVKVISYATLYVLTALESKDVLHTGTQDFIPNEIA